MAARRTMGCSDICKFSNSDTPCGWREGICMYGSTVVMMGYVNRCVQRFPKGQHEPMSE